MLFRKKMPRSCTYCAYATRLNEDEALCIHKGIVLVSKPCRKFKYDPYKRIPSKFKASDFKKYADTDYSL